MLSCRIPLTSQPVCPPQQQQQSPQQPASALPLRLQWSLVISPTCPSTPPMGPTLYRSSSPFRNRPLSVSAIPSTYQGSAPAATVDPVDVDLVVRSIPRAGKPCTLSVAASVHEGPVRTMTVAIQHVQPSTRPASGKMPSVLASSTAMSAVMMAAANYWTVLAVGTAMASSIVPRVASFTFLDRPLVRSPRVTQLCEQQDEEEGPALLALFHILLPEPMLGDKARYKKLHAATRFLGTPILLYICTVILFA